MTTKTNLNQAPYFDDFNENKNFHRILFKGRNAIQTRELNQLQSMVGNQIENFADHIFKFGSIVKNVSLKYNEYQDYVRLKDLDKNNKPVNIGIFSNKIVMGGSSGIKAKVILTTEKNSNDPPTIFVNYINTGKHPTTGEDVKRFIWGEEIRVLDPSNENFSIYKATVRCPACPNSTDSDSNIDPTGKGSIFTISSGVYYVNGYFVKVLPQAIILDKYVNNPSYDVGLDVVEEIITEKDDSSLYDNALGTPNFTAPGADRLRILLVLTKKVLKSTNQDSFILVARIENGVMTQLHDKPQYSEIMDTLARRTYDESGDYTVTPFRLYFKEHLKHTIDDNNGYFLEEFGGDANKFMAFIQPGKAYVKGYEIDKISESPVALNKARETIKQKFAATRPSLHNYILVKLDTGSNTFLNTKISDINSVYDYSTLYFYDGPASGLVTTGNNIGTCISKGIELYSGIHGTPDAIYKIFISDPSFNTSKSILNVRSLKNVGTNVLVANLVSSGEILTGTPDTLFKIYDTENNSLIFKLPKDHIKSLRDVDNPNTSNTLLTVKKIYTGFTNSSSVVTFNTESGDRFSSYNPKSWLIGVRTSTNFVPINPSNVSVTQDSITVTLPSGNANKEVGIIADTYILSAREKRKIISSRIFSNVLISGLPSGNRKFFLQNADVYKIDSIIMYNNGGDYTDVDAVDITSWWNLDNGQRDNYYGIGFITLKQQFQSTDFTNKVMRISFNYFTHSSTGYYFSVDSYKELIEDDTLDIDYETIPTYTTSYGETFRLSNVLDFRPRQGWDVNTNTPSFSGTTTLDAMLIDLPSNDIDVIYDIEFYLGRVDLICLHKNGDFIVEEGISSENPIPKKTPENTMKLYEISMKPYIYDIKKDVSSKFFDNKRYTMRDIGRLEKRIENLEYYVSFNLLEKSAADMNILDANGMNRFKNGFLVDPFTDFKSSNLTSNQYRCSIDVEKKECKPKFTTDNIKLVLNQSDSDNYQVTSSLITLPFEDIEFKSQPFASKSISVNPYDIFNMEGKMVLTPDHDVWVDTRSSPTFSANVDFGLNDIVVSNVNANSIIRDGWLQGEQSTTVNIGSSVTNVQLITHMREIEIQFAASNMRPNTIVYPFFEEVNVSEYCRPLNGSFNGKLTTDNDGQIVGVFRVPANKFFTGDRTFVLVDVDSEERIDDFTTTAKAKFYSGGLMQTVEQKTLSVKKPTVAIESPPVTPVKPVVPTQSTIPTPPPPQNSCIRNGIVYPQGANIRF